MKIEFQDKIDRYLFNQMQDFERLAFEKELDSNEELKQQLVFSQNVQRVIKSRNEKIAALEKWQDDYKWQDGKKVAANIPDSNTQKSSIEEWKSSNRSSKIRLMYWLSGIAAIFIAGFFISQFVIPSQTINPIIPNLNFDGSVRSGSDNLDILSLLKQSKYRKALALSEQRTQELRDDSLELVNDGTIDKKQMHYKLMMIVDKNDELKLLKACALYNLNNQEAASKLLDGLRKKEGCYQAQADSLYYQINK